MQSTAPTSETPTLSQSSVQVADVTEASMVARAQDGDHAAYDWLYAKYQPAIFNYIYRLMGSRDDAEDLTADTFLKIYLNLPKTSDDLKFKGWAYKVANNTCLDELRHRRLVKWQPWEAFISVFHPSQVAQDNPEREYLDHEAAVEAREALALLHPRGRACLVLREFHDLSYDEIAATLSTTRAAVKSLITRARDEYRVASGFAGPRPPLAQGGWRAGRGGGRPERRPPVGAAPVWGRRLALGLTRLRFAAEVGCSEKTIRRIEKGQAIAPRLAQGVHATLERLEREQEKCDAAA